MKAPVECCLFSFVYISLIYPASYSSVKRIPHVLAVLCLSYLYNVFVFVLGHSGYPVCAQITLSFITLISTGAPYPCPPSQLFLLFSFLVLPFTLLSFCVRPSLVHPFHLNSFPTEACQTTFLVSFKLLLKPHLLQKAC